MDYTYREIQKGTEKRKRRREESGRKRRQTTHERNGGKIATTKMTCGREAV